MTDYLISRVTLPKKPGSKASSEMTFDEGGAHSPHQISRKSVHCTDLNCVHCTVYTMQYAIYMVQCIHATY